MNEPPARSRAARLAVGALLLAVASLELRVFLAEGLPLFFDAHSHLTRSWLAARALEAREYPSWTFAWYGGYRLFEFYSPGYYLSTAGLAPLCGGVVAATKSLLYAGQVFSSVAFYAVLIRLGATPLAASFGALLYLYDPERWRVLAVIGNYPTLFVHLVAPLWLLAVLRADAARRSGARLFAASSLWLAAMAVGHLTNALQVLPALLAFAIAWLAQASPRRAALRPFAALAASLPAAAAMSAGLTLPLLRRLHLVTLSLDTGGLAFDLEPLQIALGWRPGSMRYVFVVTPGALWCALALAAGCLSLRSRERGWRACFAGLCASLISIAVLGERAAVGLSFFVAPLCAAALQMAGRALRRHAGPELALASQLLAVAAVPVWHHAREEIPLRYVDAQTLAIYQRIPRRGGLGRSFDVTRATDSVDGVYGRSSFSPYWTGRAVPFGGFPQGAPLAINVQLALVGKLLGELAEPQPALSAEVFDVLHLLHVEWLVDRDEPPRLARAAFPAQAAELREPGLLRVLHASPALFAPRLELVPGASGARPATPALLAPLEARWERDPLEMRGARSLDALSRTGTRRDWPLVLPLVRHMRIERARGVAQRFFVERSLPGAASPSAETGDFRVLAHEEGLRSVEIVARSEASGFVRLAYSLDPDLSLRIDGAPTSGVPDFLGGIVLRFPAGTHAITLEAPRATLRVRLLALGAGIAAALATLSVWSRWPGAPPSGGGSAHPRLRAGA